MAAPFFYGAGAQVNGIGSITAAWPANHSVDDIGLLVIETDGVGTTLTPAGWTHVTGSPVTAVASTAGSKLHVLWKRATTSAEPNVVIADSGDHQVARIYGFGAVKSTGDPWNAITTGTKTTASTTATLPSITTTVDESLIVGIVSRPDDSASTTAFGAPVNAGITWDSNADIESGTNAGNGGGFVLVAGVEATAGATGTTTLTCPNVTNAYVVLALTRESPRVAGDVGAFDEVGQDADLLAIRTMAADAESYAATGQDATLAYVDLTDYSVSADVGTFVQQGQDAGDIRGYTVIAEAAGFIEQGQDANTRRTILSAADVGAFNEVGQPAQTLFDRVAVANVGSVVEAGQAATLSRGYSLAAAAGTFVGSGQDAGKRQAYVAIGETGALAAAGQDAIVRRDYPMAAATGAFALSGQPAQLLSNDAVLGGIGAFVYAGQQVNFVRSYSLKADAGSAVVAGQQAGTLYGRTALGETGAFNEQGQDAGSRRTYVALGDVAAINEVGQPAILARSRIFPADLGSFGLAGQPAQLLNNDAVLGGIGQFIYDAHPVEFLRTYRLQADLGAFNEQGQDAVTARSRRMVADAVAYVWAGQPAQTLRGRVVIAAVGALLETGQAAGTRATRVIGGDVRNLVVSPQETGLRFSKRMVVDTGSYGFTFYPAQSLSGVTAIIWSASTARTVGTLVKPTYVNGVGLVYKAMGTGVTGTVEPTWPTVIGNTVVDGTITWKAVSLVSGEFQKLEPSSIIELFELQLTNTLHGSSDIYRFHAGTNAQQTVGDIIWQGQAYQRFPIEASGFEYSGTGQLPRPKIKIANVFGTITSILVTIPNGLEGAKVSRIRTLARFLDPANFPTNENPYGLPENAEFPREVYYIDRKAAETRDVVEFELAAVFDLQGVRGPKRQCVGNVCPWVYRSAECTYTGSAYFDENDVPVGSLAQDVCGKRLSSCRARFGSSVELPFGSFPGIGTYFS